MTVGYPNIQILANMEVCKDTHEAMSLKSLNEVDIRGIAVLHYVQATSMTNAFTGTNARESLPRIKKANGQRLGTSCNATGQT